MRALLAGILLLAASSGGAQVITEFPIPTAASSPYSIAAGPDGNLWFTESDGNRIGRITTAGVVTEFPLPNSGSDPRGITAGPDAALWFTEYAGNRIGRITTSGVITEFPIPTAQKNPIGIAAGSDDALWFTERFNTVGRITTGGLITELPTGVFPGQSSIAAGPDGNLWAGPVTQSPGILRIAPSGVVTNFPVSVVLDIPAIAAGPDGDIWYTHLLGTQAIVYSTNVEHMTTAGTFVGRTPILPGEPGTLAGIAAGPDGNFWATSSKVIQPDTIVRASLDLTTTEFPIPSAHGAPFGIAAGPDGAMWFTEKNANNIGRITTGVVPAGSSLTPVTPCRLGDTRLPGSTIGGQLTSNRTRTIFAAGKCGIPPTASALALNVTSTQSTSDGHLVLFGGVGAGPLPPTSIVNYRAGQTRANNAIVPLGPAQTFFVFCGQPFGSSELTLDVTGYFQ